MLRKVFSTGLTFFKISYRIEKDKDFLRYLDNPTKTPTELLKEDKEKRKYQRIRKRIRKEGKTSFSIWFLSHTFCKISTGLEFINNEHVCEI